MFSPPAARIDADGSASSSMEPRRARHDEDGSVGNFVALSLGQSPPRHRHHGSSNTTISSLSRARGDGDGYNTFGVRRQRIRLNEEEGTIRDIGNHIWLRTTSSGQLWLGVHEPSSPTGYSLLHVDPRPRSGRGTVYLCSDRTEPRQALEPEVPVPPAVSEAIPRPAAAEDASSSPWGREVFGVYKDGRLLYVTSRFNILHSLAQLDPGVRFAHLSTGLGTIRTPDGVDIHHFIKPRRTRSVSGGCSEEGGSGRDLRRRWLQHERAPTDDEGVAVEHLQEGVTAASDPAFGTTKAVLLNIEKVFFSLIHSGDLTLENELMNLINTLRSRDGQAYEEYMNLSEPSSESDHLADDPNYEPDEIECDAESQYIGGGSGNGGGDKDDSEEDDDDEEDDEDDDDEEGDEEEEDPNYVPDDHEEEEDDDDEYLAMLADAPPLPEGACNVRGVTVVTDIRALRRLIPEVHVLGFGPDLSLRKRLQLWVQGDTRGFDFQPTEMLRYVWRMELLLSGENPGHPNDAVNEPPVPNPGDYQEEGWSTAQDTVADMEID